MIYFISDTHFGHANIIKHCNRPFSSANEMDEMLIKNWNRVISPKDDVYHLGDFAAKCDRSVEWYLGRLNGRIHIVWGNHDFKVAKKCADKFASCHDICDLKYNKQKFVLCHYPFATWRNSERGSIHLHGHCHNNFKFFNKCRMDVGVDCFQYAPIGIEKVLKIIKDREVLCGKK